jgi:hypothetical protein
LAIAFFSWNKECHWLWFKTAESTKWKECDFWSKKAKKCWWVWIFEHCLWVVRIMGDLKIIVYLGQKIHTEFFGQRKFTSDFLAKKFSVNVFWSPIFIKRIHSQHFFTQISNQLKVTPGALSEIFYLKLLSSKTWTQTFCIL